MAIEEEPKPVEAPAPKKSKMMLFIIIGVVVVLLGGGTGAFFMMKHGKDEHKEELDAEAALNHEGLEAEGAGEEEELQEGEEALGAIFPLDTFVVNLDGGRYIRVQMQLEFVTRDIPKAFYGKVVIMRDSIITALTKKSADDVLSEKGKDEIRKQVKDIVNEVLRKEEVKHIYFTQYIVN